MIDGWCECGSREDVLWYFHRQSGTWKTKKHDFGKHPRPGFHKRATYDHETIRKWFVKFPHANFAIKVGVKTITLDLDVREGQKNGVASLQQFIDTSGNPLLDTVKVLSGSMTGSTHLYFRPIPDSHLYGGTHGIDFLKNGHPAIIPGSLHASGHYYQFAPGFSPDEIALADMPEWLLECLVKPSRKPAKEPKKEFDVSGSSNADKHDLEHLTDRAARYDQLLKAGPWESSTKPGRLVPDGIVVSRMRHIPKRREGQDRSSSDWHWACRLAYYTGHNWDQYIRLWFGSPIRAIEGNKLGIEHYEVELLRDAFLSETANWENRKRPVVKRLVYPKSDIAITVVNMTLADPTLGPAEIVRLLNSSGLFRKPVTKNYVKTIRKRYRH